MKPLGSNITRTLDTGAELTCADNSGAKKLEIIGVKSRKGRRGRRVAAGVGDQVTVKILKGDQEVKHQVFDAVIVRQAKEYQRPNGTRVEFEDNAAVLVEEGVPKGNVTRGPIAKEVVRRFSAIGKIASQVV
ncbi:uL14 family ribosomal protein [Candidatus Nanohalococcus occultus]|uniref:uL14 family ribosomal protein n=1 Tax=Candidatus Nanohalococcus occultus TaxID=2978047 RepID=UPI0039DF36A2